MDTPDADPPPADPDDPPAPAAKPKKSAGPKKQTKNAGMVPSAPFWATGSPEPGLAEGSPADFWQAFRASST